MSAPPPEGRRARRAPIGLADAPLADYRPAADPPTPAPSPPRERARAAGPPAAARAPDPRAEPTPLAREATRSVNFHIPRSLDRVLGRLKYELEAEYGVRTTKTALAAAALYALPREPLAALAWLRAYEEAELPLAEPEAGPGR
jgi:hypothetical protein